MIIPKPKFAKNEYVGVLLFIPVNPNANFINAYVTIPTNIRLVDNLLILNSSQNWRADFLYKNIGGVGMVALFGAPVKIPDKPSDVFPTPKYQTLRS